MRALAEFTMRGRTQAVIVGVACVVVPLMFWVSAAVVGLVTLRKGTFDGSQVLLWVSLPAIAWFMVGDPMPTLVLLGTFALSIVLRQTMDWSRTLVMAAVVGLFCSWVYEVISPDAVKMVVEVIQQATTEVASKQDGMNVELGAEMLTALVLGVLGAVTTLSVIMSLMFARWWQSMLYNPGGFQSEFHLLRLTPMFTCTLLVLALLGGNLTDHVGRWIAILSVPCAIAGAALLHGIVAKRDLGNTWLVVFYGSFLIVGPYLYVVLVVMATLDSFVNIRKFIKAKV